jgi:hypothetical protein
MTPTPPKTAAQGRAQHNQVTSQDKTSNMNSEATRLAAEKARRVQGVPLFNIDYIQLRGYSGTSAPRFLSVLCGQDRPVIMDGYAMWTTVPRPLRTGVTTFQGYNPAKMTLSLTFGIWTGLGTATGGWECGPEAGQMVEADIATLEWMAGANFNVGSSPYVYVNSYGNSGGTTNLVSSQYQETSGASKSTTDTKRWPWVIDSGIQWGTAIGNNQGDRVYQECTLSLTNFQGFSKPPTTQSNGAHFKTSAGRDTILSIANAPANSALSPGLLATAIQQSSQNNPVPGTGGHLKLAKWSLHKHIGAPGKYYTIWVPGHTT